MMPKPPPRLPTEPAKRLVIRIVDGLTFVRWRKKGLDKYQLLSLKPAEITAGYGLGASPVPFSRGGQQQILGPPESNCC